MKNQGISLISLIITIIVIIILAAIVIFTGLGTPDSAQFSNFCSQVDNVYVAMLDSFGDLKASHAISGDYRTNEQIYLQIATGVDHGQYDTMGNNDVTESTAAVGIKTGSGCQLIKLTADAGEGTQDNTGSKTNLLDLTLPKVRESANAWYVTEDGRVFNATGYVYDGNTYFNASVYLKGNELPATTATETERAQDIWKAMANETGTVVMETITDTAVSE